MRPGPKLALFGAGLVAAFGLGAAVGAAVGPIDVGGDERTSITTPDADPAGPATGSVPTAHAGHG